MTSWRFVLLALADIWFPFGKFGDRLRGRIATPLFKSCGSNLKFKRCCYFATPHRVTLGSNVWFSNGTTIGAGDVTIEDEVLFGPSVCVHAQNHTRKNGSYRFGVPSEDPVFIRKGSWIGANAVILAGADIGAGSVVAAGAVVLKGIYPPNSLLAGVPAKIKKELADG